MKKWLIDAFLIIFRQMFQKSVSGYLLSDKFFNQFADKQDFSENS